MYSYPENGNMGSWNFEYHDKMELKKTMLKVRVVQEHQLVTAPYQAE
jgi:hypothetical protein